jgi:hypothetical protein
VRPFFSHRPPTTDDLGAAAGDRRSAGQYRDVLPSGPMRLVCDYGGPIFSRRLGASGRETRGLMGFGSFGASLLTVT